MMRISIDFRKFVQCSCASAAHAEETERGSDSVNHFLNWIHVENRLLIEFSTFILTIWFYFRADWCCAYEFEIAIISIANDLNVDVFFVWHTQRQPYFKWKYKINWTICDRNCLIRITLANKMRWSILVLASSVSVSLNQCAVLHLNGQANG